VNKAFVREPDADARVSCPRCSGLAIEVGRNALDTHVQTSCRNRLGESAWFCRNPVCEVIYFDLFEQRVLVSELRAPVYPKDLSAPICACFGLTVEEIEADLRVGEPVRIRELYRKSQSGEARCSELAVDGRCCMGEVQRLYLRGRESA
jgi:hypothetical protein